MNLKDIKITIEYREPPDRPDEIYGVFSWEPPDHDIYSAESNVIYAYKVVNMHFDNNRQETITAIKNVFNGMIECFLEKFP